jgi:hypothetical protein
MSERDACLVALRPKVVVDTSEAGPIDIFQSRTLHPILKLQNPLILGLVAIYLEKYCPRFPHLPHAEQVSFVRNVLKRDSRPKHMLVGMVAGQFTQDEFTFFVEHEAELRRRLIELCIQRVQDQVHILFYRDNGDEPASA